MPSYRFRPEPVEAMFFDGTPVGARAVIDWLGQIAPDLVARQRVEYRGWDDTVGHVELEIRDHDDQSVCGDWIVLEHGEDPQRVRIYGTAAFHRRFEIGR